MFPSPRSVLAALLLAAVAAAGPAPARAGEAEIVTLRTGAHARFTRLVVETSRPVAYEVAALGARDFVVLLRGAVWRGGRKRPAAQGLIDDVSLNDRDGDVRVRVLSRRPALVSRAFDLPALGGGKRGGRPGGWRIVIDLAPAADWRVADGNETAALIDLPPMHGFDALTGPSPSSVPPPVRAARAPAPEPAPPLPEVPPVPVPTQTAALRGAPPPTIDWPPGAARPGPEVLVKPDLRDEIPLAKPEPITLTWSRASKILRDIYDHVDPAVIGPGPRPPSAPDDGERIILRPPRGVVPR